MPDADIQYIHKKISTNNYLSNCYRNLTRAKVVHFILILIETALNILNLLDIILNDYLREKTNLKYIAPIPLLFKKFSNGSKLFIIIFFVLVFDSMHIILNMKDFKKNKIYIKIIINFLELFHFRVFLLLYFYLFFSLAEGYFLIALIFVIFHIYLIIDNFRYCHLYYFVPAFIEYPYDAFSSLYDIILVYYKIISSLAYYSSNKNIGKFFFIILLLSRILFCVYFFEKSLNHSYLLMKNTFLNKTRHSSIWIETIIMIAALIVGSNELKSIYFILVCICIFIIIVIYTHFLYNPYNYIHIEKESPDENLYFYFYIKSDENSLEFLFEDKLRNHFDKCGYCLICKKFINYLVKNHKLSEEEEKIYINIDSNIVEDNSETEFQNKNQLNDLFDIIYNGNNKYFYLLKQIIENYKIKSKLFLNNNLEYYFINLSFLIYSDYTKFNINLSLNEKIILEHISHHLEIFDHQARITQLLLCNKFMETCKSVIDKIRDILNSQQNFSRAQKLIDLSFLLTELKQKKYRYNLFSTKLENVTTAKNLILICSIFFEEIFNTVLSNTQMPIRSNLQILEDTFLNSLNKNDKKISLALSLNNKECKIIRAGKGLSQYLNENLFGLFPLEFKQYQIELFTRSVLNNFNFNIMEKERVKEKERKEKEKLKELNTVALTGVTAIKRRNKSISHILASSSTKLINLNNMQKNKTKKDYIKIELIICQNILSKIYYQLVTLRLTPLFNSDYNYFILLDGVNLIHKHTVITMIDQEQNHFTEENVFSISEPRLELHTEIQPIPLRKYKKWLYDQDLTLSTVFCFNIYSKVYYIYMVLSKNKDVKKKTDNKNITLITDTRIMEVEEMERERSNNKNSIRNRVNYIEDTASFFSQKLLSNIDKGITNIGFKNKKSEESYQHTGFNKIRKIAYLIIVINIIIIIIEYIHLMSLEKEIKLNNNTFLEYREFYKIYFQLFSMTLSVACVEEESSNCNNVVSYYIDQYYAKHPEDKFDILSFLHIQNYAQSLHLIEKRNIFINIYKYMGAQKYNEIFRKPIEYLRINKTFVNGQLEYNIIARQEIFSELLIRMCNNYKFISTKNTTKTIIYILNGIDNIFSNFAEKHRKTEIDIYQQYIYELIINHKSFSYEFENINECLKEMLIKRNANFKLLVYVYLNLNIIVIIIIEIIIYLYIGYFEKILIIILNTINMTLNNKIDDFKFNEMFSEKIDNLENIIKLYNESPRQYLRKINDIYNNYQQYLINKKKKEAKDAEKKGYKMRYEQKMKESEEVPKSQRILNKKNVRQLRILNKYIITYSSLILIAIVIYIFVMILWSRFFVKQENLYILLQKNTYLETTIFRAINLYYIMIFNNLTANYATEILFPDIYNPKEPLAIFKYIYSSLNLGFNYKIERDNLGDIYYNSGNLQKFSCVDLYQEDAKYLVNLYNEEISINDDVENKLKNMCLNFLGIDSDKSLYLIENHFQYIKNGIIDIDDFSYEGLKSHIKKGYLGRISLFFNLMMTFMIDIVYTKRNKMSMARLLNMLEKYIQYTGTIFILYDFVLTIIIIFFFIRRIKNYCNQIMLLKNTFQITKVEL